MLVALAQTLARWLAGGTSLHSTERISFSHPAELRGLTPSLNLYCYDLREQSSTEALGLRWLEVSFLVSARGGTGLGEQHLMSETLGLVLNHRALPEEVLAPDLQGHGQLALSLKSVDAPPLWQALGAPLRLALYLTVTLPFITGREPHLTDHPQENARA